MSRHIVAFALGVCVVAAASVAPGCAFDKSGVPQPGDGGTDSETQPICGDGVRHDGYGEACDGDDLGGETCVGLGYAGGTLICSATCELDESVCEIPANCGNGVVDANEECDGLDLRGETCATATGLTTGNITCRPSCQLDTSDCHTCGDDSIDGPELCDGANLGGQSCVGLGYVWGNLACTGGCQLELSGCADYPANWYDLSCPYRKIITINPAGVDAPLTMFPLLVQLTDTDLRDNALSTGADIRFADATGGQQFDHELESYDAASGALVAWVGVDTISDTTPTELYLYYGDAGCGQAVDPAGVWDANYRGVWHLAELFNSPRLDSAGGGLHATPAGYDGDEAVVGWLDGADLLDGVDDHLLLPGAATNGLMDFTICFWIRTTEVKEDPTGWKNPTLLGNISNGLSSGDFGILTEVGIIGLRSGLCTGTDERDMSTVAVNDDLWHYVCAVAQGSTIDLWVDGAFAAQVCAGGRPMQSPAFWVGGHSGESASSRGDFHQGVFDELRISSLARPPAWRNASYANQLTPGAFYSVGTQEALP